MYLDLLKTTEGAPIETLSEWEHRKTELKELFEEQVYGRFLREQPLQLTYTLDEERTIGAVYARRMIAHVENLSIPFMVYIPMQVSKPPVVIYNILKSYNSQFLDFDTESNEKVPSKTTLPLQSILDAGIAIATYRVTDVNLDEPGSEDSGLCAVLNGGKKTKDSSKVIRAWAQFSSIIADYLLLDGRCDENRMGVAGHSRGGKTALVAAVYDDRFSFAYVSNSGCTGASMACHNTGERIQNINDHFPHWFCEQYKTYNGHDEELPFDFHELCALMAPRKLYVTSSSDDAWACPQNELESCKRASLVYEKIYHKRGLVIEDPVELDKAYQEGTICYHIKKGSHSFDYSDWQKCITFILNL